MIPLIHVCINLSQNYYNIISHIMVIRQYFFVIFLRDFKVFDIFLIKFYQKYLSPLSPLNCFPYDQDRY